MDGIVLGSSCNNNQGHLGDELLQVALGNDHVL